MENLSSKTLSQIRIKNTIVQIENSSKIKNYNTLYS